MFKGNFSLPSPSSSVLREIRQASARGSTFGKVATLMLAPTKQDTSGHSTFEN